MCCHNPSADVNKTFETSLLYHETRSQKKDYYAPYLSLPLPLW